MNSSGVLEDLVSHSLLLSAPIFSLTCIIHRFFPLDWTPVRALCILNKEGGEISEGVSLDTNSTNYQSTLLEPGA